MLFLPYPPVGKATSRTPDSAQARNRNHRALKLVGLLALALALLVPVTRPAAAESKLETILLPALEVGDGYQLQETTENTEVPVPNITHSYVKGGNRGEPNAYVVSLALIDFNGVPNLIFNFEAGANGFVSAFQKNGDLRVSPATVIDIGDTGRRYSFSGVTNGVDVVGDIVLWQHDKLFCAAVMFSNDAADVLNIALHQDERISAMYGLLSGSAVSNGQE